MNRTPPDIPTSNPVLQRKSPGWQLGVGYILGTLVLAGAFVLGRNLGFHFIPVASSSTQAKAEIYIRPPAVIPGSTAALPKNVAWDPKSALAEIIKKYAGSARLLAVVSLIEKTPVAQLANLLDQVRTCPEEALRNHVRDLAFAKWTTADPQSAFGYAMTSSVRDGDPTMLKNVLGVWASINPKLALDSALAIGNAAFRTAAIDAVLTAWVQGADPLGAVAAVKSLSSGQGGANLLEVLFKRWAGLDPIAAFAALDQIDSAEIRRKILYTIFGALANSDPARAFAALRNLPPSQRTAAAYKDLFLKWSKKDPTTAFAALHDLPPGAGLLEAAQSLFSSWAALDPKAALQAALSLPFAVERDKAIALSISKLATQDLHAAADIVAALPAGLSRNNLVGMLSAIWANTDPNSALAWLDQNTTGTAHTKAVAQVLAVMSKSDPAAAMAVAVHVDDDNQRNNYIQQVLATWAKTDAASALSWVYGNLAGSSLNSAVNKVLPQFIQSDPLTASAYVAEMSPSSNRDSMVLLLASQMTAKDIQSALTWVRNLPEGTPDVTRKQVLQNVIGAFASSNPTGAAAYAQSLASDPYLGPTVAQLVAAAWAKSDGQAAYAWAESLPNGATRDSAMSASVAGNIPVLSKTDPSQAAQALASLPAGAARVSAATELARNWVAQDMPASVQWVSTLPAGPERDAAIIEVVQRGQSTSDPAGAFALAVTVSESNARMNALIGALSAWVPTNPSAAQAALDAANLPASQHDNLTRMIQNPQNLLIIENNLKKAMKIPINRP